MDRNVENDPGLGFQVIFNLLFLYLEFPFNQLFDRNNFINAELFPGLLDKFPIGQPIKLQVAVPFNTF
jgi:hypothetical protein